MAKSTKPALPGSLIRVGRIVRPVRCVLAASIALAMAACAWPGSPPEQDLSAWEGASEAEVIRGWGAPEKSEASGGRKTLVYTSRRTMLVPTSGNAIPGGSPGPDVHMTMSCTTTFQLEASRVVSWSNQGNACRTRHVAPSRPSPAEAARP